MIQKLKIVAIPKCLVQNKVYSSLVIKINEAGLSVAARGHAFGHLEMWLIISLLYAYISRSRVRARGLYTRVREVTEVTD